MKAVRLADGSLIVLLALIASYWLGESLIALWKFGFGEVFADQFRQYLYLADASVSDALLAADNGHRMLLANLLRRVDIQLYGGDQGLLISAGIMMMLVAALIGTCAAWRSSDLPPLARWAALLAVVLALFWRGAGRMQFHGNESFQVYLVIACASGALLAQGRYLSTWRWGWLAVSLGFALLGALSFATGVAILPALLVMALLSRTPLSRVWPSLLATVLLLLVYLFLLPGGDGVRGTLHFSPMKLLVLVPSWLSSAWFWALPGLGEVAVFGVDGSDLVLHPATAKTASALAIFREGWGAGATEAIAMAIGCFGLLLLSMLLLQVWRRGVFANSLHRLGLGLALFCAGVAGLVALGRMAYFANHPSQLFADRYVLWSAVFWMGLLLALIGRFGSGRKAALASALGLVGVAGVLWNSQSIGRSWMASSARLIESRTAALQADVYPAGIELYADLPDLASVRSHRAAFHARGLGPFRSARGRALGQSVSLPAAGPHPSSSWLHWAEERSADGGRLHVLTGELSDPALRQGIDGVLLLNAQGIVVGSGEFGYADPAGSWQRLHRNALGFDVFAAEHAGCGPFTLVGVDDDLLVLRWLGETRRCIERDGDQTRAREAIGAAGTAETGQK